jgi:hypothetical protein
MSEVGALHVRKTPGVARMAASAGLMAVVMPEEIAEVTNLNRHKRRTEQAMGSNWR